MNRKQEAQKEKDESDRMKEDLYSAEMQLKFLKWCAKVYSLNSMDSCDQPRCPNEVWNTLLRIEKSITRTEDTNDIRSSFSDDESLSFEETLSPVLCVDTTA
eukprot:GHVO01033353.1.p1 GENE.GHVO01033353.1~~GHVO01033353.1.p1  ORF type:complete len:102 (-),score=22.15 GHVO01033353.1:49-354(-)